MADIVPSLFGLTPEMYQQQQSRAVDEAALQYAQLTPFQQAQFAIGRGAYGLAGAIGGALGAEDPQLKLISQRNAIAKQIDPTNPESMVQGIRALSQAGDAVGAMQLTAELRKLQSKMAQTFQSTAAGQASLAQASKSQAEIDEINRQQLVFNAITGKAPPAAAPAKAMPAMPAAALTPEGELVAAPIGAMPSPVTLPVAADATAPPGETSLAYLQRQFGMPGAAAAPPDAAPAAPAAATALAQTRATLNQQIATLESRRGQLLALTKIPAAKAEADVLGDQIKDLRSQLKPTELTNLEREIDQLRAEGAVDTDPRIKTRLDKIVKLSAPTSDRYGQDREAIAKEEFDKNYIELTQDQRRTVNKILEDRKGSVAEKGAPKVYQQGQQVEPKDWIKFEDYIEKQPTFKRTASIISAAPSILRTIRQSTGNDFAARALPASIARLFDEGALSNQDVRSYAITGGLDDRLASLASNFFTGTVTSVTKQQAEQFMTAIYRGALLDQKDIYIERARRLGYAESPNYKTTIEQLDEKLAKFKLMTPPKTSGATGTETPAAPARTTGNSLVDKYLNPQSQQR